jgi:hypothetical protein
MEVTMLDEDEYAIAYDLYGKIFRNISANSREERNKDIVEYYFNLTGEKDTNPNSIIHHRIALYGPPCEKCGKPYRTPKASFCASCGHKRGITT